MHPSFDDVVARLLAAVEDSVVVFLEGTGSAWAAAFRARLADAPGLAADRVVVLPRLASGDYGALMSLATAVLDTHPYSGFTTSIEALSCEPPVPVVARRARTVRGCQTAALYAAMGGAPGGGLVARSADEYVAAAAALARNASHRGEVVDSIGRARARLFGDAAAGAGWARFLRRAVALAASVRDVE